MSDEMIKPWLADYPWETIKATNYALCAQKSATFKETSEGYLPTKKMWEVSHKNEMTLDQAATLCRECHKQAPFCNFNGNTFAAIGKTMLEPFLKRLEPDRAFILRSGMGHYIAGTIGKREFEEILKNSIGKKRGLGL